ncbi:unnamed protein product [Zymoseptoria tritici ST99CH_1A5]|uniref:Uncharacterized protein n=2 Tax=Zymoseptoria tritici TaxID=1047171 RepID=A0A2H1H987_ZYMTR|nr:unnamed protein product [Zymoseptoria tritici ST99CH_1E4]SMY30249.1 unnamed protein product [Zymoseptoria tritici ST99CH_1A5]
MPTLRSLVPPPPPLTRRPNPPPASSPEATKTDESRSQGRPPLSRRDESSENLERVPHSANFPVDLAIIALNQVSVNARRRKKNKVTLTPTSKRSSCAELPCKIRRLHLQESLVPGGISANIPVTADQLKQQVLKASEDEEAI